MNRREIIRQLFAESICVDFSLCKDEANFRQELGADSLSLLCFVTELNEQYGVHVSLSDEEQFILTATTVRELIDKAEQYIQAKIG